MHLNGRKFFWSVLEENPRKEDGFEVEQVDLRLGYWRKHPNLHGFIVKEFADGKDECQEIELSGENLRTIIEAVKERRLPTTSGFFFGKSYDNDEQRREDVKILQRAIDWVEAGDFDPVVMETPKPVGGGLAVAAVQISNSARDLAALGGEKPKPGQKVSRTVVYRASW
jgi:sugar phosphate isomerase/epimerase